MNTNSGLLLGLPGACPLDPRCTKQGGTAHFQGSEFTTTAKQKSTGGHQGRKSGKNEPGSAPGLGLPDSLTPAQAAPLSPQFLFGFCTYGSLKKSDGELAGPSLTS